MGRSTYKRDNQDEDISQSQRRERHDELLVPVVRPPVVSFSFGDLFMS